MMNIAAAALVATVLACSSAQTPTELKDTTLTVLFGKTVSVPGTKTTISFTEVTDSRCPQNVACVWEGDAAVRLESAGSAVVLHTSQGAGSSTAKLSDMSVTLVDVKPAPVMNKEVRKSDYVVTLRVTP